MRFINLGDKNNPVLLFYHGACSHWSWYREALDELAKKYFVIVPVIDGYDDKTESDFISVEHVAKETTDYLLDCGYKKIHAIYGFSLGGAITIRILAENRIDIDKAVIDAGITPYQLPWIITRIILLRDYFGIKLLRSNVKFIKMLFNPEQWSKNNEDEDYQKVLRFMRSLSNKTIKNSFDSANNYSMPDCIPKMKTQIQYWYGSKEKKARAFNIKYVKKTFKNVVFKEIEGMNHGEFIMMHPKECTAAIINFIN